MSHPWPLHDRQWWQTCFLQSASAAVAWLCLIVDFDFGISDFHLRSLLRVSELHCLKKCIVPATAWWWTLWIATFALPPSNPARSFQWLAGESRWVGTFCWWQRHTGLHGPRRWLYIQPNRLDSRKRNRKISVAAKGIHTPLQRTVRASGGYFNIVWERRTIPDHEPPQRTYLYIYIFACFWMMQCFVVQLNHVQFFKWGLRTLRLGQACTLISGPFRAQAQKESNLRDTNLNQVTLRVARFDERFAMLTPNAIHSSVSPSSQAFVPAVCLKFRFPRGGQFDMFQWGTIVKYVEPNFLR